MSGIIPSVAAGGVEPPSAQLTNAYVPPAPFTTSCTLRYLPNTCSARILPAQINALQSELLSFAVCLDPDGHWDCTSPNNLCTAFTNWLAGADFTPSLNFTDQCGDPIVAGAELVRANVSTPELIAVAIGGAVLTTPGLQPILLAPHAAPVMVAQQNGFFSITNNFCVPAILELHGAGRAMIATPAAARTQVWSFAAQSFCEIVDSSGAIVYSEIWQASDNLNFSIFAQNRSTPAYRVIMAPGQTLSFNRQVRFINRNDAGEDIYNLTYNLPGMRGTLTPIN